MNKNVLEISGVSVEQLAATCKTPLYVYDENKIRQQLSMYHELFQSKDFDTEVLYASKAFSCKAMVELVKTYGLSLDVVSGGELFTAYQAGFPMERVYFHGNNKLPSEIEYALENGVENFVIDNFYEIDLVQEIASRLGVKINGIVRITPGVYAGGHDYIRVGAKDTKFGFSSHDNTYLKAIKKVIDAPNINFDGIHCHVGSQIEDIQAYVLAMNKFVEIAYEIYDIFGIVINKLNAGGGFGIAYTAADNPLEFETVVDTIMEIITKGFDARGLKRPMVLVEPGRYCVGNAGITLYTVGSSKYIKDIRDYITVDGGMTDNIRSSLYAAKYDAIIANKAEMPTDHLITVAGKNCESGDILIKDIMLQDPEPGDILAMFSTGAYHYSMSSNYNQLPKPAVVFTYEGKDREVIRRQTFDDLVYYDIDSKY